MRALALLSFLLASSAAAQPLTTGTWTGTLDGPGAARAVTAEIERCAEGLKLNLSSDDGRFRVSDTVLRQSESTVYFGLTDANERRPLACTTERQADGSLEGSCQARRMFRGARYTLRLHPPAQGTIGCSE